MKNGEILVIITVKDNASIELVGEKNCKIVAIEESENSFRLLFPLELQKAERYLHTLYTKFGKENISKDYNYYIGNMITNIDKFGVIMNIKNIEKIDVFSESDAEKYRNNIEILKNEYNFKNFQLKKFLEIFW